MTISKYPSLLGAILIVSVILLAAPPGRTSPAATGSRGTSSHRGGSAADQDARAAKAAAISTPDWEIRYFEIAGQDIPQQSAMLRELAAEIPESQIRNALDRLAALRTPQAMTLVVFLGDRWAQKSPGDVAPWAATHVTDDLFGRNLFSKIMTPWAHKDLPGAVVWVRHMSAGANKSAAIVSLATEAAALKKGDVAVAVANMLPPGSERDDLLDYAAQQWATTDRRSAVAWIESVQDLALRQRILGDVAVNIAIQDPAAGADFAVTTMPDGIARDRALGNAIRFWAASTPDAAADWVKRLPEGPMSELAIEGLMETWGRKNRAEAKQWLEQLPAGHKRDTASNALARLMP